MSTTTKTLDDRLAVIAKRAPELRRAGVLKVEIEGVVIDLLPEMPTADDKPGRNDRLRGDLPWDQDPDTFGGHVPTLRRDEQ